MSTWEETSTPQDRVAGRRRFEREGGDVVLTCPSSWSSDIVARYCHAIDEVDEAEGVPMLFEGLRRGFHLDHFIKPTSDPAREVASPQVNGGDGSTSGPGWPE